MSSVNQCNFIGRLGKDPEIRQTSNGAVANMSIAVSDKYKGEEKTEWVRCVMFGKLAEVAGEYLKKGKEIYVSGKMQTQKWQDKEGIDRYTTEIVCFQMQMLGGKDSEKQDGFDEAKRLLGAQATVANTPDDDVPF